MPQTPTGRVDPGQQTPSGCKRGRKRRVGVEDSTQALPPAIVDLTTALTDSLKSRDKENTRLRSQNQSFGEYVALALDGMPRQIAAGARQRITSVLHEAEMMPLSTATDYSRPSDQSYHSQSAAQSYPHSQSTAGFVQGDFSMFNYS